ncbi:unnamed protein product [Knipowitschia caucasica]
MGRMRSLFWLSIVLLMHLKKPVTCATPLQPSVEIVTGHVKVFTGDSVKLKCVVPATPYNSIWTYAWYNGHDQMPDISNEHLIFSRIKTKQSGKYCCQAFRDTSVQDIPTSPSLPVEISVDGGWAILDTPSQAVVGFPLYMVCRVRGNYPIHEVVLYRNGEAILVQDVPKFILNNLTVADWGVYTCRASWNQNRKTYSVISAQVTVQVVEPLTQPSLTVVDNEEMRSLSKLKLECVLEYNVPDPAPLLIYYFYINDNQYGTPTSDNYSLVERLNGIFKCQAKVPQLGLSQWSEPVSF